MSVRNSFLDPTATLQPVGGFMNLSAGRDQCFVRLRLFILSHLDISGLRQFWVLCVICLVKRLTEHRSSHVHVFKLTESLNLALAQIIGLKIQIKVKAQRDRSYGYDSLCFCHLNKLLLYKEDSSQQKKK